MVGSLQVPNVQALAANIGCSGEENIPARYIRSEEVAEPVVVAGYGEEIPVIDFSRLLDHNFSSDEFAKLDSACRDWGFFQLINHKISSEVIEEMKGVIEEFLKLPLCEKQAISQPPGDIEGYGQLFVFSDDQKLDWADMLYLYTHPVSKRKLHLWPTFPSKFRDTLIQYSSEVFKTSKCLINLMLRNLGVDANKGTSEDFFKDWTQSVRINYYPPCPQSHRVLGLSPHSDAAVLTLLLQVNQVPGLQIKRDGVWVPVTPLPGALVVNIGDSFEILSNGEYKSIEHRAVVDESRGRISIGAFSSNSADVDIGPLPELLAKNEARYATLDFESFKKLFLSTKLGGKRFLDSLKIKN